MAAIMERERPQRPRLSQIASSSSYSQSYTAPKRTPHDSNPHAHAHTAAAQAPMQAWRYPLRSLGDANDAERAEPPTGRFVSLDSSALADTLSKGDAYTPRQMPVSGPVSVSPDQENANITHVEQRAAPMVRNAHTGIGRPVQPVPIRRVTSPLPNTSYPTPSTHSTPPTMRYKTHRFAIDVEAQHSAQDYANPEAWMSTPRSSLTMSRPTSPTSPTFAAWGNGGDGTYTSPSTPGSPLLGTPCTPTPRVVLGGLVSSPTPDDGAWDEHELSIEVPGIVLTEPHNPTRIPSPPPKHILLLPPTSLTLPMHSTFEKEKETPSSPLFGSAFHHSPSRPSSPSSISTCGLFARRPSLMSLTSALRGRGFDDGGDDLCIPFASAASDRDSASASAADAGMGAGSGPGASGRMVNLSNISRTPTRPASPAFAGLTLAQSSSHAGTGAGRAQKWALSANTIRMLVLAIIALLALGHFYMDTLLDLGDRIDAVITTSGKGGVVLEDRLSDALR